MNEWAYSARQVHWDIFLGEFLQIIFDQKQMLASGLIFRGKGEAMKFGVGASSLSPH